MPFVKIPEEGFALEFTSGPDPYPKPDVFQNGERSIDEKYARLAKTIYGENEEQMEDLIQKLKFALEDEGLKVPGEIILYLAVIFFPYNVLFVFLEYDHLYRKFLRGGGLDIPCSVDLFKKFIKELNDRPKYYEDIVMPRKCDKMLDQLNHIMLPHR